MSERVVTRYLHMDKRTISGNVVSTLPRNYVSVSTLSLLRLTEGR